LPNIAFAVVIPGSQESIEEDLNSSCAYAQEQATKALRPPVLVERGPIIDFKVMNLGRVERRGGWQPTPVRLLKTQKPSWRQGITML
jgi:hypothetical protein